MIYSNLNANVVVIEYLASLFRSNESVGDIVFGFDNDFFNGQRNFPLVHIMQTRMRLNENRILFDFDIAIVSERDRQKRVVDNFYGDNIVDNLNESTAIFITAMNVLMLQHNEFDILLEDFPSADTIIDLPMGVDGCESSITLSIQNEISSI